jgi:glycerol-1-phosphate dehydrogenase [NAD(P)+]
MLIFGKFHPASGGEHHVSHIWEMAALKEGKKQQLHGAKVGVPSILVANRYKTEFDLLVAVNLNS